MAGAIYFKNTDGTTTKLPLGHWFPAADGDTVGKAYLEGAKRTSVKPTLELFEGTDAFGGHWYGVRISVIDLDDPRGRQFVDKVKATTAEEVFARLAKYDIGKALPADFPTGGNPRQEVIELVRMRFADRADQVRLEAESLHAFQKPAASK